MEAVNERQQITSLGRDEKAQARALASQTDKMDQLRAQRDKLTDEAELFTKQKEDVRILFDRIDARSDVDFIQSEEKVAQLQQDLARTKQELSNHDSEKRRIR